MAKFNLSPYRVARFYFHECDRYLRYAATPRDRRVEEGVPDVSLDRSIVTRALLEGGHVWEEVILDRLGPQAIIAPADPDTPRYERRHGLEETLERLAELKPGEVLYQPTIRTPDSFYTAYGLDRDLVRFVDCYPDLVMAAEHDGGIELQVLDAKASDSMRLAHRIQVALYSIMLDHLLTEQGLRDRIRPSRLGGVWLFEQPEPEWFDLSRVRAPLETFLAHELTPILRTPASEAFWHLYFRCEWCDYYQHCRAEAEETNDVSLVPYLSTFAKRHLHAAGVRTVDDFDTLLDSADERLTGCASLEGRSERFRLSVKALKKGEPKPTGAVSVAMPKGEQIRLVITTQSEPLSGAM